MGNLGMKQFNAKLLLFGEYGLMFGAKALSIPYNKFFGQLQTGIELSNMESSAEILHLFLYFKSRNINQKLHFPIDMLAFESDLEDGLYFESTIPRQYGLGSSAALVAALFNRYAHFEHLPDGLVLSALREDLAMLENFFHGRSSGLDPLASYLNHPVLLKEDQTIEKLSFDINKAGLAIALINTKETSETGPLVNYFLEQMARPEFRSIIEANYIQISNECILNLLNGDLKAFFMSLHKLVLFQISHFSKMIPEGFEKIITDALDQQVYVKLLGSGGGGYLLAFANSHETIERWKEKYFFDLLWVV